MSRQNTQQSLQFINTNIISLQIATFVVIFFPPLGGLLYIAGSIVYWPILKNVNPNAGGVLFTIGSVLLMITDIVCSFLQPQFTMVRPLENIGSFKSLCSFIGNLAFTVGSVFFLPGLPVIVGQDLFLIASIFNFIPQILSIWGVITLNLFTAEYYVKMALFKKTLIWINVCLALGCLCFFIGTFLFENIKEQSYSLNQEGVMLFIIGSLLYLIAPLIGLKMRKVRLLDPLRKYHEQIHRHYLPRQTEMNETLQPETNNSYGLQQENNKQKQKKCYEKNR